MRASDLPLSILIVGVGGADFKQMEVLYSFIPIIKATRLFIKVIERKKKRHVIGS